MNIKKLLIISLIIMFLIIPVSYADDGDYTIPIATNEITVKDDGSTIISEDITYEIEGKINGVYREIPHDNQQEITDISVETPGYYNTVEVINKQESTKIKVWLYKDKEKTQKVKDAKVQVIYKYTFNKGVKIYNDIAELQYISWGSEWQSGVDTLKTIIHIPGSNKETEYWNNPEDNVITSTWVDENTLETKLENIGSHTLFEQRILMPTTYFKSSKNAKVINMDAKAQIEEDQRKYAEDRESQKTLSSIITGILGLLMIIPLGVYALFGREPEITYQADYEYDLPTKSSPVEVNSIVPGNVGQIDQNAINAVILDLINRKFYKVMSNTDDDTIIRQTNNDTTGLKEYEKSLINYLSKFKDDNNDISLKELKNIETPENYQSFKSSWIKEARIDSPQSLIDQYFISKGSRILNILAAIFLIIGVISWIIYMVIDFTVLFSFPILIISTLLIIEAIVILVIPNTIGGRWTSEGKEYHDKWKNFENYISDYSLINERPPASIEVWGKYLIYATALGCAKNVTKNMEKYFDMNNISENYYNESDVVRFAYFGGLTHMESSFTSLSHTDSDSDGIGSAGGGGFGGGGGGTF